MEFPPILVINLPQRKDRWEAIEKILKPSGLYYERVDAVKRKPGWKGCSLSHRKCIEIAKERKWPMVLILEDDCLMRPQWKERFQAILPSLWATRNQWEVFNGGGSVFLSNPRVVSLNPVLFSINSYGTQCMLIHEGTYDKILREVGDHLKIDVYYTEKMKAFCTFPHLSTQQASYSDIERKVISYDKQFMTTENKLASSLKEFTSNSVQSTVTSVLLISLLAAMAIRFHPFKK